MSKIVKLDAAGTAATVADAKLGDILSTLISTDSAVTGMYKLLQSVLLVTAGMSVQSFRDGKGLFGWLNFGS